MLLVFYEYLKLIKSMITLAINEQLTTIKRVIANIIPGLHLIISDTWDLVSLVTPDRRHWDQALLKNADCTWETHIKTRVCFGHSVTKLHIRVLCHFRIKCLRVYNLNLCVCSINSVNGGAHDWFHCSVSLGSLASLVSAQVLGNYPHSATNNMHFIVLRCHSIMFLTMLSHICQQRDSVCAQHTASR